MAVRLFHFVCSLDRRCVQCVQLLQFRTGVCASVHSLNIQQLAPSWTNRRVEVDGTKFLCP